MTKKLVPSVYQNSRLILSQGDHRYRLSKVQVVFVTNKKFSRLQLPTLDGFLVDLFVEAQFKLRQGRIWFTVL